MTDRGTIGGATPFLEVEDLSVVFRMEDREIAAVRDVSFRVDRGETVALVGESGSGKSVTALSVLQLLPYPKARHPTGSIRVDGEEVVGAAEPVLRGIRGNRISMIFQEPMTLAQSATDDRAPDQGESCSSTGAWRPGRRANAHWNCFTSSACATRSGDSTLIPTSSPGGSASAS